MSVTNVLLSELAILPMLAASSFATVVFYLKLLIKGKDFDWLLQRNFIFGDRFIVRDSEYSKIWLSNGFFSHCFHNPRQKISFGITVQHWINLSSGVF